MRTFDYSFLRDMMVPAGLLTRVAMVEGMRVRNSFSRAGHGPVLDDMFALSQLVSVQAVRRRDRLYIEDVRLVDLFLGHAEPETYEENLIVGYRDALRYIHAHHQELPMCIESVQKVYSLLVSRTGESSEYRSSESVIMLPTVSGEPRYVKSPVDPTDLPECMSDLFGACAKANQDLGINKYLLIPCFMLDFLCIQPYRKHNGMIARLCVVLLMYRLGLDIQRYVSYDQVVIMYLQSHYDAFIQGTQGWSEGDNDYVPYISEFARDMFICMGFFERRMRGMHGSNEKSLRMHYQMISTPVSLSKRDVCELMPDISEPTVEASLSRMVKDGTIVRTGGRRNSRYLRPVDRWY